MKDKLKFTLFICLLIGAMSAVGYIETGCIECGWEERQ